MTHTTSAPDRLAIDEQPWPDDVPMPPSNLPYDDGDKMESPWHFKMCVLLMASYLARRGGRRDDYFMGANMFVYYSAQQVRNKDYRGPDVFLVKDVDAERERLSWIVWEEGGRYPDVIFELLSASTEHVDFGFNKKLYEQVFRTKEYFCIAPNVERLIGWRLEHGAYVEIKPDERGWLWSEELDSWLGPWHGTYLYDTYTWLRFYDPSGALVLLPEEAERERAEAEHQRAEAEHQRAETERERAESEHQRADDLAARLAALEAEIRALRGEESPS